MSISAVSRMAGRVSCSDPFTNGFLFKCSAQRHIFPIKLDLVPPPPNRFTSVAELRGGHRERKGRNENECNEP